jgi:hypothetical protein
MTATINGIEYELPNQGYVDVNPKVNICDPLIDLPKDTFVVRPDGTTFRKSDIRFPELHLRSQEPIDFPGPHSSF